MDKENKISLSKTEDYERYYAVNKNVQRFNVWRHGPPDKSGVDRRLQADVEALRPGDFPSLSGRFLKDPVILPGGGR